MAFQQPKEKTFCKYCGWIDKEYDENSSGLHEATSKHNCNRILYHYKNYKSELSKNRDGISIFATAVSPQSNQPEEKTSHANIIVHVKPKESCKFSFYVSNELKSEDVLVFGIQLAHPQPHFMMNKHPYNFNEEPKFLPKKSSIKEEISVAFKAEDIGQYEMPIMFTFHARSAKRDIIFIREMVALVEEFPTKHTYVKHPYTDEPMAPAENFLPAVSQKQEDMFKIPKLLKFLLPRGLGDDALDSLPRNIDENTRNDMSQILSNTRAVFEEGMTVNNYMNHFHHLLWWEEVIAKISIKRYNMHGVTLIKRNNVYLLEVPGLAEKRPSLIRGDRVCLQPHENLKVLFECVIRNIDDTYVHLLHMDHMFEGYYSPTARFDVRFVVSRVPIERCHSGVYYVFESKQHTRVFPEPAAQPIPVREITKFYNPHISQNRQQKSAVEHIVSGTSGLAPYIVFGPPGTGKTMTIVEAIIQLVVRNVKNRVLVCTDSNMAADHIALALYKYNKELNIKNFLFRANSQMREWSVMPSELAPVSNGSSFETFFPMTYYQICSYRIVVTTLLHSAKYIPHRSKCNDSKELGPPSIMPYQPMHERRENRRLLISHLFIDEAAQASEPAALIPISGLLQRTGQLVLAGDPQQLGPVCLAREAAVRGLGTSLLERLYMTYPELYSENPNYITTLVNNFRSHPDILNIPNQLFYRGELQALAPKDELSNLSILGTDGGDRAIVFHAVQSKEQRMGRAPSYFNEKELEMLKRYVTALIIDHKVEERDIGIIAPYIRQVYKMKAWLKDMKWDNIDVGTVEAFQGKEKRVILVSTVRANCKLLDYDATYSLGFLVDDKRFNVAITRAKAKLVIIGNFSCLNRDLKWRIYMNQCKKLGTYLGEENQQMDRNSTLLQEIAKTRFDKCRLTDMLKENMEKKMQKKLAARRLNFNM